MSEGAKFEEKIYVEVGVLVGRFTTGDLQQSWEKAVGLDFEELWKMNVVQLFCLLEWTFY